MFRLTRSLLYPDDSKPVDLFAYNVAGRQTDIILEIIRWNNPQEPIYERLGSMGNSDLWGGGVRFHTIRV
jgi:hypothetical protein